MREFLSLSWLRRRLALKASLIVGGLVSVFALLMTGFNVWGERNAHAMRASEAAMLYAERTASAAMRAGALDHPDVRAAMEEAARQDHILYVSMTDQDGALLADRGLFDAAWTVPDAELVRESIRRGAAGASSRGGAGHASYPVFLGGRPAGAVRVTASMDGAGAAMQAALRRSMIMALFGLGIVLPLAGLYLIRAMRPMQQIIETARDAARGRLDSRLDLKTGDELGDLAESFNAMLDRLKGSLEHVRQLAYADHLTGLPNKTAFLEHARALLGAQAHGALFLVDLDRFKRLNDTFGAKQGDRLIRVAAQRVQAVAKEHLEALGGCAPARPGAAVAEDGSGPDCRTVLSRVTADEFALIVAAPPPGFEAEAMAGEIVRAIEQPMEILGQHVVVTGSVGIVRFPDHGAEPELLMRHANFALDEVKKAGGASCRVFDQSMTQAAMERVTLEHDLRRALENDEFLVHYQPKIAARTGVLTGVEALIRWRLPDGTIRAPGAFIGVAEETGLIAEMGDYVLREACRAAARWQAAGLEIPVAVNVSALQFERRDFRRTVEAALEQARLAPEWLELELTESTAMTDPERASAQIEPLRRLGVRFAIDDFGTGHSSLAHLTRMPFDTFKIDQSFIRALGEDPDARAVVQTILALARALRLETVAEGAETAEQVAMLQTMGCNMIQGYYFARPMAESDLVAYARRAPEKTAIQPSGQVVAPFGVISA